MKQERGRVRWAWERIPGIQHNEALDARNYALAALRILDPNMDAVADRLRAVRSGGDAAKPETGPKNRTRVKKSNLMGGDAW